MYIQDKPRGLNGLSTYLERQVSYISIDSVQIQFRPWKRYNKGDLATHQTIIYSSLADCNIGNIPSQLSTFWSTPSEHKISAVYTAGEDLIAGQILAVMDGTAVVADKRFSAKCRVIGIADSAVSSGQSITVIKSGNTQLLSSPDTSSGVFLGNAGLFTQIESDIAAGEWRVLIGYPVSDGSVDIQLGEPFLNEPFFVDEKDTDMSPIFGFWSQNETPRPLSGSYRYHNYVWYKLVLGGDPVNEPGTSNDWAVFQIDQVPPGFEVDSDTNSGLSSDSQVVTLDVLKNGWTGFVEFIRVSNIVTVWITNLDGTQKSSNVVCTLPRNFTPFISTSALIRKPNADVTGFLQLQLNGDLVVNSQESDWYGSFSFPVLSGIDGGFDSDSDVETLLTLENGWQGKVQFTEKSNIVFVWLLGLDGTQKSSNVVCTLDLKFRPFLLTTALVRKTNADMTNIVEINSNGELILNSQDSDWYGLVSFPVL